MGFLSILLSVLGIILIIVFILALVIAFLIYKFAKKYPILSIFLLILLIVIGTLEVISIGGIAFGVATYITAVISLLVSYKKLKKGLN
jgi:hypothetical protein